MIWRGGDSIVGQLRYPKCPGTKIILNISYVLKGTFGTEIGGGGGSYRDFRDWGTIVGHLSVLGDYPR